MCALAAAIGIDAGFVGLLLSHHVGLPSGPCIVLACGLACVVSALLGRRDGIVSSRWRARRHCLA